MMLQRGTYRFLPIAIVCASLLCSPPLRSQGTATVFEPRSLIDVPTASILPHGNLSVGFEVYQPGGLLTELSIGAFDRFLLSISYGGTGLIGDEKPVWNPAPGVQVRVRLLDETMLLPAIGLGFNSQGKESYVEALDRYTIKSLGFYAVASKNYLMLGYLSLHGGINYSLERADGDENPNLFVGVEKTLGPIISTILEYNLGSNDSHHDALGRGRGYLNMGIRLAVGKGLSVGLNLKDIAKNQDKTTVGSRVLTLEYAQPL